MQILKQLGIKVCNTPLAPVVSVADHALALIFLLAKKLCEIDRSMSGESGIKLRDFWFLAKQLESSAVGA